MNRFCFPIRAALLCLLISLVAQTVASAGGRIENHQIASQILADNGESADRNITVYLPEGYDGMNQAYPVLYLLHGAWGLGGNTSVFFGEAYHGVGGRNTNVNIDSMIDRLIENGEIQPLIIVMPNVAVRVYQGVWVEVTEYMVDYIAQEVVPFIDKQYRTISNRQGRAIAGHSNGGTGASSAVFLYPELFSLVGFYAGQFVTNVNDLLDKHDQSVHPLEFWTYVGTKDNWFLGHTRHAVSVLEKRNIPHLHVEDDGDHFNKIAIRLEESLLFLSERLSPPVTSVTSYGKLQTLWGNIKYAGQNL